MASHTGHDHPATPAARAACRKGNVTISQDDRKVKVIDVFHDKITVLTREEEQKYTGNREITVWLEDGQLLGTVTSYRGSLDRRAGNLRVPGKMRTLWSFQAAGEERTNYWAGCTSIAQAIRHLLR